MKAKKYNSGGMNDPKKKKEDEYLPRMLKKASGADALEALEGQIKAAKEAGDMGKVKELVEKYRAATKTKEYSEGGEVEELLKRLSSLPSTQKGLSDSYKQRHPDTAGQLKKVGYPEDMINEKLAEWESENNNYEIQKKNKAFYKKKEDEKYGTKFRSLWD